jgi:tRNA (guanine26-N2/guanine27-N2)-dimethyltransferase
MKEIGVHVKKITANDWDPEAAALITKNFEFNNIDLSLAEIKAMDGVDLMYEKRKDKDFYDVVDLDPYGTAVPFLDASIQAIEDGGLL